MMISIGLESFKKTTKMPFLQTGFRPFFLMATGYAVLTMFLWMGMYSFHWDIPLYKVSGVIWHAHEMIYGYVMAVIAGFLLTAVRNWTKLQTADGKLLLGLMIFWSIGRIPPLNAPLAYFQAAGDIMFGLLLFLVIASPILHRKMSRQWPVLIILFALLAVQVFYYLGMFDIISIAPRDSVYVALYVILNLVFIFARRLIPNFINSALKLPAPVKNMGLIDKALIPLFLAFAINEIVFQHRVVGLVAAIILLILNSIRLVRWYNKGIWSRHLIWSLYVGYAFLTLAFLIRIAEHFLYFPTYTSLHMFTVGGIGMITLSMMTRVSFGHTGRNVLEELNATRWLFYGMILTVLFRVLLPMFAPRLSVHFIGVAMVFWMIGFAIFWFQFFKILIQKRSDGMYG